MLMEIRTNEGAPSVDVASSDCCDEEEESPVVCGEERVRRDRGRRRKSESEVEE